MQEKRRFEHAWGSRVSVPADVEVALIRTCVALLGPVACNEYNAEQQMLTAPACSKCRSKRILRTAGVSPRVICTLAR